MENLEYINLPINLDLFAKQVVEGFITGLHKSPYHGFSVEFAEHRLYNNGESTRHIDWKLYGRTDKLFNKRYEEETNLRCQIVLDTSSSMYYPNYENPSLEKPNKILFSVYATAVLMNLLKRQRDAIGLSAFTHKLDFHSPNRTTQRHYRLLYNELDKLLKVNAIDQKRETASSEALHQISEMLHKRSMVMIFTDMIADDKNLEEQFEAFKHLKYNKHEVVLFYLTEPKTEIDLEFENKPHKFIDVESGQDIKLSPNQLKELYKEQAQNHIAELKLKCLQYKIDLVEVDINKGFEQILISYLLKRKKML
ncbi:MAG TPA: DUF58 domain-containing protein [Flavobacteriales bacterium]|nr:DUF58 domain-containing protein [Flavobacteriales bacterium]